MSTIRVLKSGLDPYKLLLVYDVNGNDYHKLTPTPSPSLTMAPMFIPRAGNSCSATYATCPSDADTNTGVDPTYMNNEGPHRFIGVAMVAGLVLIVFLVWLYRGRWPRKKLQQYCCCRNSEELLDDDDIQPTSSEKGKSTTTPRDSELVKEVSAGMVVFTRVPKAVRSKEGHHPPPPVEWEMDPVNGIRLEVFFFFACHFSLC